MPDTANREKAWEWLRKSGLKVETEALTCAAQEQALGTNYAKYDIDKKANSHQYAECAVKKVKVGHIVWEC